MGRKGSNLVWNRVGHHVFDDWQLSGITQFVSGTPNGVGFTTTDSTDLTGGGDGQRINVVGNARDVSSSFYQWFDPAAFARPPKGDFGNAGKVGIRNPGVNNFVLSPSKHFP